MLMQISAAWIGGGVKEIFIYYYFYYKKISTGNYKLIRSNFGTFISKKSNYWVELINNRHTQIKLKIIVNLPVY